MLCIVMNFLCPKVTKIIMKYAWKKWIYIVFLLELLESSKITLLKCTWASINCSLAFNFFKVFVVQISGIIEI